MVGTSNISPNQQQHPTETTVHEEEKTPSDFSINHHRHRTCEYNLMFTNSDKEKEEQDQEYGS